MFCFSQVTDNSYIYAHFDDVSNQTNLLQWSGDNLEFIVSWLICVDRQKYCTYWYSQLISLSTQNHCKLVELFTSLDNNVLVYCMLSECYCVNLKGKVIMLSYLKQVERWSCEPTDVCFQSPSLRVQTVTVVINIGYQTFRLCKNISSFHVGWRHVWLFPYRLCRQLPNYGVVTPAERLQPTEVEIRLAFNPIALQHRNTNPHPQATNFNRLL